MSVNTPDIRVEELKQKLDDRASFLFIDVRERHEYEEFNLGAQLIPLGELYGQIQQLLPYKDEEVVVHCRSGNRSGMAKELMQQMGFTRVRNLIGGILEWQEKIR